MDDNLRDLVQDAMKGHKARYIEIRVEESEGTHIIYRGKNLEEIGQPTGVGGCVRALGNGWGFASFNTLDGLRDKVVTGRVKNTVISGNVYSILKGVQAIESESHWVGGSLKMPSLYLDKLSVAAKM